MMFFIFFLSILSIVFCKNENQQIINIHINEELPLLTILFTTENSITYRLFDSGRNQNSFVNYNSSNGHILLTRSLDREYLCSQHICSYTQCQLTIELIEWQLPYRLLKLILNIKDINDQIPTFSLKNYQLNIMENVPIGLELSLEQANDADLGENSRISYELERLDENNNDNKPFELITKSNGGLGLKVIQEIDREERDSYQYKLIAYDHGQPRQQSSTKLYIQVHDMNDNPVVLSETYIQLNVSENTPVGTELTRINATDEDIGLNGKIHYSFSNGFPSSSWMDYFRIGESTGILTLINPLDYESEQSYHLTIQVRDLGENSLTHFVTIDISILDENDNAPQAFITFVHPFLNNSTISIPENTPIGQMLAHITISDQDSDNNSEISYRIEQGDDLIGIKILDQRSFLLIIKHLIDRESEVMKSDRLILIISDHGKPSKSIRLEYQINIIDINDSPPMFNQSINCNLHFNRSIDQYLFQIEATDLDLDDNGRISYSILPPYDNSFIINNQGQVFNSESLNESNYHLQIMAIDHGKPIRLNSTYHCHISTFTIDNINKSLSLIDNLTKFDYNYSYIFIILSISVFLLIIIFIIVYLHQFILDHSQCLKRQKTYHLYVSLPRKSSYLNDQIDCNSEKDEHESLVYLNCDRSSDSINKKSNSYPSSPHHSSISSIVVSGKHSNDSDYESKEHSRPVSLSISTATTCTSNRTDSPFKLNIPISTVVRLAEEEKIDI